MFCIRCLKPLTVEQDCLVDLTGGEVCARGANEYHEVFDALVGPPPKLDDVAYIDLGDSLTGGEVTGLVTRIDEEGVEIAYEFYHFDRMVHLEITRSA